MHGPLNVKFVPSILQNMVKFHVLVLWYNQRTGGQPNASFSVFTAYPRPVTANGSFYRWRLTVWFRFVMKAVTLWIASFHIPPSENFLLDIFSLLLRPLRMDAKQELQSRAVTAASRPTAAHTDTIRARQRDRRQHIGPTQSIIHLVLY